jgi:hypothetical protein
MKTVLPLLLCVPLLSACGSSSSRSSSGGNDDDTAASLPGTWLSNCHEYLGVEGDNGDPVYSISEITFAEASYSDVVSTFTDMNCTTPDGAPDETFSWTYTLGEDITAADGASATRMTADAVIPDQPDLELTVESVIRITGVELNIAEFVEDEVPAFDLRVTYTKQ